MLNELRTFFDHSRHSLSVDGLDAQLDVLAFEGSEALSETFRYRIEVTSLQLDIPADSMLGKDAAFSLRAAPSSVTIRGYTPPVVPPLRTLYGVITGFKRLSASRDEARYELMLEPRLALLRNGSQNRIYQNQSIPEIVEIILRRHGLRGQDFLIDLGQTYAQHEQRLQYGETDLAYIQRICAERGIWFSFGMDSRLLIDVAEFHDAPMHYEREISLPLRPLSSLESTGKEAVWDLQVSHQVVEQVVSGRAYYSRDAGANLDAQADLTREAQTTYGEAYHYANEHYQMLGDPYAHGDEEGFAESGVFYARLAHERYLNQQTRLFGSSSSAELAPGKVLKVEGGAPAAFAQGAVIVRMHCKAARDSSFEVSFEAIPDGDIAFRPPVPPKPRIAGTVPARVTNPEKNDPYSHIDKEGRYKVNFLFDRDTWPAGRESMWLRLARPYAGDTYGFHMPLLAGTEVGIAFEQGDPDRPFIAHAIHDSLHPDHVTIQNYKRNVIRTPSNNKIRLDDTRGQEHIKVSTEHSGKSQLNLGHLVDAKRQKRGEGFELRTDDWGALRAGKGVFISADVQPQASGDTLEMSDAIIQLENALSLARSMANAARSGQAKPNDSDSQARLSKALTDLAQPGILLHAPAGIGVVSPEALQLASSAESVGIMAGHNADISAGRDITASAQQAVSLFAQSAGMQLKAAAGKVEVHAQSDALHALAKADLRIESTDSRVEITAPQELLLHCGGAYIRIKDGNIELGAPGNIFLKAANVVKQGSTSLDIPPTPLPAGYSAHYILSDPSQAPMSYAHYQVVAPQGEVFEGITDKEGRTMTVHTLVPGDLVFNLPESEGPFDEQLCLSCSNGNVPAGLKYVAYLADGTTQEGQTDKKGRTARIVTNKSVQITRLELTPPDEVADNCCSAKVSGEPLIVDLEPIKVFTNSSNVGTSTQVIPLPEGDSRPLTAGEIAMAQVVFKDAIDYSKVKAHHGGWWLFLGFQNTAVTPNGEMYFPESTGLYKDDFSATAKGRDKALFIHEMTHVWQYQMGYWVKWHALWVTSRGASAYEYTLRKTGKLSDYNMEQQGEIVSDYYMICVEQDIEGVWNQNNKYNDPLLLASTVKDLLSNPADKANLP
ncbi:type VI secretion system tip protein VgrG [Pseudomonas sp. PDM18]|uniref:type VI secretion system Vgr family protein n=1 Tax=Pseudomonas sp. PDM18 TaxID=2769253 RepID=UPI00177D779E|nr:type VI secretion system Vgr family protein [Pseudomonas sp. PDM18]MBD9677931.1 type VI secretion system tip protein VgrG [Pseudomonas sp. PDM18]